MTEKRQPSQGYIIRILQHFATKLWNITNFVMFLQAVMKFLSRLVEIKILSITQVVNWPFSRRHFWGAAFSKSEIVRSEQGICITIIVSIIIIR
jgi:hypothetical protein